MSEGQKRSFSHFNSSSSNRSVGSVFIKPPTSPIGDSMLKERIYSPPIQHRHAIQQQQPASIGSSSFTSLSSITVQESIHQILPKPPLSVTNRQNNSMPQQNILLSSTDFTTKGNVVQQIHQKLIQKRSQQETVQRGANFNINGFQKVETGGVSLVTNIRSPSPILHKRVQNLSNSVNHNTSKNNINNSASHNNSIDVVVNNPYDNMQYDIVNESEKEYLKSQLRLINDKQIFLSNSPSQVQIKPNFITNPPPPQTIIYSTRSDSQPAHSPIKQFSSVQQPNLMSPPHVHKLLSPQHTSQALNIPKNLTQPISSGALFIKPPTTPISGGIQETQTLQNTKPNTTFLSESAQKLLDTYKRQKEILFDSNALPPVPLMQNLNFKQNDLLLNGNQVHTQFKGIQSVTSPYTASASGSQTPNILPAQQPIVQYNNQPQTNNCKPLTSLKDITQPYIQTPEQSIQTPIERQRSTSQKGSLNNSASPQTNNINYSSIPSQMIPGSSHLTKITTRPVTTIEEKHLIEEIKQKNHQRRNSISSSSKSNGNQLQTVVEATLEQSMRLSSLLVNTSVFNQAKNSASQSRENSLESITSKQREQLPIYQIQPQDVNQRLEYNSTNSVREIAHQAAWTGNDNDFRDFSSQNQIIVVEDFDGGHDMLPSVDDQGVQVDFDEIQVEPRKEINRTTQHGVQEQKQVIRSAQTNYIDSSEASDNQNANLKECLSEQAQHIPTKEINTNIIQADSSPKNKKVNNMLDQNSKKEKKYRDAQTSPIKILDARASAQELNSLITETNFFDSKNLVESQFVITESSTVQNTQQALYEGKGSTRQNTRHSDKIIPRSKEAQPESQIDDDYMKTRKKEIVEQIKEKKLVKKNSGVTSKTPRSDGSAMRMKPSTPNNNKQKSNQFNDKVVAQHASPPTKRDSRISLDSVNLNNLNNANNNNNYTNQMKQSKSSFEGSISDSQTQSVASVQQLALQKRDEILDKIKHIDEQLILHQKIQNQQKDDDLVVLKQQNKMIIPNSAPALEVVQNIGVSHTHNKSNPATTKSNQGIEDTPIKKIHQNAYSSQQSSSTTIQLPVTSQQVVPKTDRNSFKRSESNSSLRRQGSNRKIEGYVIQSNEPSVNQINQSSGSAHMISNQYVNSKPLSQNQANSSNKLLHNYKDTFVNKNTKMADFNNDLTLAQKQLMTKGYNSKGIKSFPTPSQPTSSRSTTNMKKKDLKISNVLDKSQESKGTSCLSSTNAARSKQIYDLQSSQNKRVDNEVIVNLGKTKNTNSFNTKENVVSEPLGVINLFEIAKNKKRDSSLINRNQNSKEEIVNPTSPSSNHYFKVSDKLKEFERNEQTTKLTSQSKNKEFFNSNCALVDHSSQEFESKYSAKFNSVLQDMSNNYNGDSKNMGFTIIPPTQELDLEAEHSKRQMKKNNQLFETKNNPYLLKKEEDSKSQGAQQKVQIKGNKYQFSFDKNLDQEDRIPSSSFTTKYNDGGATAGFAYDCSPILQKHKADDEIKDQLSQIQAKQLNRLEQLEQKFRSRQFK